MNEVMTEIMKEKRTKAKAPPIFIAGILNQLLEKPANINPATLKVFQQGRATSKMRKGNYTALLC